MSRGKERLDWSSKTLIVFQVRHFLRPWETVLPIRRGHCHHYCVPKGISHLLRVSTLKGDFVQTHNKQPSHSSIRNTHTEGSERCLSGQISSTFWHQFPEFRPRLEFRPTNRACRDVLPNLRPQSGRDKRTTRRESRARAHRPCQVVGSPLPSPST